MISYRYDKFIRDYFFRKLYGGSLNLYLGLFLVKIKWKILIKLLIWVFHFQPFPPKNPAHDFFT